METPPWHSWPVVNQAYNAALDELLKTHGEAPSFRMVNEHAAVKLNVARYITDGSDPAKVLKERHAEMVTLYKAEGQATYRAHKQSTG